jgi:hypothetical protein
MEHTTGYVYVPNLDPGSLAVAAPGAVVRKPDATPPWIVVDHAIETALVARWPGRMWRVEVLDTAGVPQASATANYTRAVAVRVVAEIPVASVFGVHGEAVVGLLSFASGLDAATAERLAANRHPEAGRAYSRAWQRWLGERVGDMGDEGEYSGTLAAGPGPARSPVNCGFSLLQRAVWERAEAVVGSAAFVHDDEGERSLGPCWGAAAVALLDAAMASGAPAVVTAEESEVLLSAFRSATQAEFGQPWRAP